MSTHALSRSVGRTRPHLLLLVAMLLCGCHDRSTSPTIAESADVPEQRRGRLVDSSGPLTRAELEAFLAVVRRLPSGTLPTVDPYEGRLLPVHRSPSEGMREFSEAIRREIRSVLAPETMADLWRTQSELQESFEQMAVDPGEFGELAVKVSLAWGAASLSQNLELEKLHADANAEVERLISHWPATSAALRDSGRPETVAHQRRQFREAIEASVSLAEFTALLTAVPDESVHIVRQYRDELRHVMAEAASGSDFEHRVESTPQILRVSHRR